MSSSVKTPTVGKYRRKDSLADHQRIVHGAAKLKCQLPDCPALFSRRQFYLGHMWTKHGIGSGAKCDECGKREMTLGLLRKHRSDVHGAADLKCTEPGCQVVLETFSKSSSE